MLRVASASWPEISQPYSSLIVDPECDSQFLRENGLLPNVLNLLGDCTGLSVLDVGCGNGWLCDKLADRFESVSAYECDIVSKPPETAHNRAVHQLAQREFKVLDICALDYSGNKFDRVVASLVLMWVEELEQACGELFRVTNPGGRTVISLMHPFSYRMGEVDSEGDFIVRKTYTDRFTIEDLYIGGQVGPIRYYHRPVSDYTNCLVSAGFVLQRMVEWAIDMQIYAEAKLPGFSRVPRTGRVPMYLFLQCEKPKV